MTGRTNLVREGRTFLGRESDLGAIDERFARESDLVTITGPAGVGKTQLARHYGLRVLDREKMNEVRFCDLAAARTADDVCRVVLAALGLESSSGASNRAMEVARALVDRTDLLLILDNFEHLVSLGDQTVGAWLGLAPVHILVTSRERLRLHREDVHELGPLDEADAVALLLDRMRRGPQAMSDASAEGGIALDIVHRLDRLPLAVELAAGRLGVLTLAQLQARLAARFELLTGASRDAPVRHKTLRGALDWSWELLTAAEQSALLQVTIFRGGFTLEAAEAVVDVSDVVQAPPVIDLVQALVDKSLVVAQPSGPSAGRFDLYETVREYALGKLAAEGPDRGDRLALRHARYYLARAAEWLIGTDRAAAAASLDHLARELENLRAIDERFETSQPALAVRAMLALAPVFRFRHPVDAHRALLDRAVTAAERAADPSLAAEAHLARAMVRMFGFMERQELESDLERAEALAATAGRADIAAEALARRAFMLAGPGSDAPAWFERARQLARDAGEPCAEAVVVHLWATWANWLASDSDASSSLELTAMRLLRDAGLVRLQAQAIGNLAQRQGGLGDYAEALERCAEALAFAHEIGDRRHEAFLLTLRANALHGLGRLPEARMQYEDILDRCRRFGLAMFEADAGADLAIALCELGEHERALALAEQADELAEWVGFAPLQVITRSRAVVIRRWLDGVTEVAAVLDRATSLALSHDPTSVGMIDALRGLVDLAESASAARSGDPAAAAERLSSARARLAAAKADPQTEAIETRLVVRWLEHELERFAHGQPAAMLPCQVTVGPEASWFRVGAGPPVALDKRHIARRLLDALVQARLQSPGEVVSRERLLDAAWPGEAIPPAAALQRLWVAMSGLRKLGLQGILQTAENGYLLSATSRLQVDRSRR